MGTKMQTPGTEAGLALPNGFPSLDPSSSPCPWLCSSALMFSAHPWSTLWTQHHAHEFPGISANRTHMQCRLLSCLYHTKSDFVVVRVAWQP